MLTKELLMEYKQKNPKKYLTKYGDKTIPEILGEVKPAKEDGEFKDITSEISTKEEVVINFKETKKKK